jgi:hypothetical protein
MNYHDEKHNIKSKKKKKKTISISGEKNIQRYMTKEVMKYCNINLFYQHSI